MRALDEKLITPKAGHRSGGRAGLDPDSEIVFTPADNPGKSATFRHATHTQWLACKNCHSGVFKKRDENLQFTHDDMKAGKYCGACHFTVVVVPSGCKGCHAGKKPAAPRRGGDVVSAAIGLPSLPAPAWPSACRCGRRACSRSACSWSTSRVTAWFLAEQRRALYITAQQIDSHHAAQELLAPELQHACAYARADPVDPERARTTRDGVHAELRGHRREPRSADGAAACRCAISTRQLAADIDRLAARRGRRARRAQRAQPDGRARRRAGVDRAAERPARRSLQHRTEVLTERYHDQQQLISITAIGDEHRAARSRAPP